MVNISFDIFDKCINDKYIIYIYMVKKLLLCSKGTFFAGSDLIGSVDKLTAGNLNNSLPRAWPRG